MGLLVGFSLDLSSSNLEVNKIQSDVATAPASATLESDQPATNCGLPVVSVYAQSTKYPGGQGPACVFSLVMILYARLISWNLLKLLAQLGAPGNN